MGKTVEEVRKVLREAGKSGLTNIIVMGDRDDGETMFFGATGTKPEVLYRLRHVLKELLNAETK